MLHHPEGVVHHDGDVEGRATPAVALGLHVRDARSEDAGEVDVADTAAEWWREGLLLSCDRATARVNARLGLVDVEVGGGVGRMVVAGEREEAVVASKRARYLTTPPPRTAQCRALRSRRVVESIALKSTRSGTSDVMKTSKTQLNLRPLEQDNCLLPKTTSKTSWKDSQKCSPF